MVPETSSHDEDTRSGEEQETKGLEMPPRMLAQTRRSIEIQEQYSKYWNTAYSVEEDNYC